MFQETKKFHLLGNQLLKFVVDEINFFLVGKFKYIFHFIFNIQRFNGSSIKYIHQTSVSLYINQFHSDF